VRTLIGPIVALCTLVIVVLGASGQALAVRPAAVDESPVLTTTLTPEAATETPPATSAPTETPTPVPTNTLAPTATGTLIPPATSTQAPVVSTSTITPIPTATVPAGARVFTPVADARVEQASPDGNFGAATTLIVDTSPLTESYLRFEVSGLAGPVERATLRLWVVNETGNGPPVSSCGSATWSDSDLTWNTRPATRDARDDKGAIPAGNWIEYDVTPFVTGNGSVCFGLLPQSSNGVDFSSREASTSPQLIVTGLVGPTATSTETAVPTATRTALPADAAIVLAAGDIGSCGKPGAQATGAFIASEPGTVLALGDLAYESGTAAEFASCYEPVWGSFKDRTYPAAGNHEYVTPGAADYFSYFGARAGDPTQGYYSLDIGSWHVVALNSNCSGIGGCGAGSPQEQWLRADLEAHPSTCILAFWHHPLYSSGLHGNNASVRALWQALYEYGAEIVLNGHDHIYERFAPQDARGNIDGAGIREFVVGTGGNVLYALGTPQPNSEVVNNQTFGVLRLVLLPTGYEWAFVPVMGGAFTDNGSGSCSTTRPPAPTATATRTAVPTVAPSDTPLPTATAIVVSTPTDTTTPELTQTPAPTGTPTATSPPASTATPTLTATGTNTAVPTPTQSPTATVTATQSGALTFAPVADTRVEAGNPNANFGAATALVVDASPQSESYLRFNVSGLTGSVQSATLRLRVLDATTNGPPVSTCGAAAWNETGLTWNSKPAMSSPRDDKGVVATGTWLEYDVTPFLTGNGNVCFGLIPQSSDGVDFSSKEGANPPQLVITIGGTSPTATTTTTATPSRTMTATATPRQTATQTPAPIPTPTPTAAPTGQFVFTAAADARVERTNPNTNYGAATTLNVDTSPSAESYVRFDVAGLSGPVRKATLRLWVLDPTSNGPPVSSCGGVTWTETGITWNTKPAASNPRDDKGAIAAGAWVEYDVTPFVTGNGSLCLALIPQSSNGLDLSSREGVKPPQLVIT
jgi:hypothetical protein